MMTAVRGEGPLNVIAMLHQKTLRATRAARRRTTMNEQIPSRALLRNWRGGGRWLRRYLGSDYRSTDDHAASIGFAASAVMFTVAQ